MSTPKPSIRASAWNAMTLTDRRFLLRAWVCDTSPEFLSSAYADQLAAGTFDALPYYLRKAFANGDY